MYSPTPNNCRCGGIGRHKGLKIPRGKTRTSSSLVRSTNDVESGLSRHIDSVAELTNQLAAGIRASAKAKES